MTTVLPRLLAILETHQKAKIEPIFNALAVADETRKQVFQSVHYGSKPEDFAQVVQETKDPLVVVLGAPSSPQVLESILSVAAAKNKQEQQQQQQQVKLVHCLFTGIDGMNPPLLQKLLCDAETKKSIIPLSNARGVYSEMLAQHCLLSILYFARQVTKMQSNRKAKIWDRYASPDSRNMNVLFCGYGEIAKTCAKRCIGGLGVKVTGVRSNRSGKPQPESVCPETGARVVFGDDEMDKELPNADVVIAVLPNTPETKKVFNEERFAKFKKGAIFVNIGRGHTVDDTALIKYLKNDHLGGAAIDVFEVEPLPTSSPLWSEVSDRKMLLTSHNADISYTCWEEAAQYFAFEVAENFVLQGKLPEYLVDLEKGY
jgi:phosphoglycerate dehydrogenase-like enzyme